MGKWYRIEKCYGGSFILSHGCNECIDPVAVRGSAFGRGSGPVFLKDLLCIGSERNLLECRGAEVGIYECNSAGIYCGCTYCLSIW